MAQQSARRDRKNQCFPPCHQHALGEVVPVCDLQYGPAAYLCIKGRTDGSIRLRVRTATYRLQPKGRPQMISRRSALKQQVNTSPIRSYLSAAVRPFGWWGRQAGDRNGIEGQGFDSPRLPIPLCLTSIDHAPRTT